MFPFKSHFFDHSCFSDPKNPVIRCLNINSLGNNIADPREIMSEISLDCFIVSETKWNDSFPSAQFQKMIKNSLIGSRKN